MRVVALLLLAVTAALAAYCHGGPSPDAKPNLNPPFTSAPVLINETTNGKLYIAGPPGGEFYVMHLWGSPYEMGFAHGTLVRDQLRQFLSELWTYIDKQVGTPGFLEKLPSWLAEFIVKEGVQAALALEVWATGPYTESWFVEEIQGLADAAGVSVSEVMHVHMIGELTKGACSLVGAWGDAVAGGRLLQMRALDWDTQGPYKNYAAVMIYHPTPGTGMYLGGGGFPRGAQGHAFANVGFLGWVGSLTGMSAVPLAINEIGVSFPDDTFGTESRFGIPFTFLLRDILQFDESLDDTIDRLINAHRTCDLILGTGDGNANTFRAFQYSASVLNVIDDQNLVPANDTWHPKIRNVVYYGMDWLCPGYNEVLAKQIQMVYGNLSVETMMRYVNPIVQTGDLHIAIYDYANMQMYVSFAAPTNGTGAPMAYDRQYTALNLTALFAEEPPAAFSAKPMPLSN